MLFGTCNCKSSAASISRRDLLCTGGAGFVSALIGTLVGTARTARAQTLGSRVPEVDRLAVSIVTDNYFFPYLLSQNDGDLAVERFTRVESRERPPSRELTTISPGLKCQKK